MRDRVLIVEDDSDIRETLVEILDDAGVEVRSAVNGRDALDWLERCADAELPCVILLDLMMPVMDGPAFHEALRASARLNTLKVVVMSAYQDLAARAGGIQAVATLSKPLELRSLFDALSTACPGLAFA